LVLDIKVLVLVLVLDKQVLNPSLRLLREKNESLKSEKVRLNKIRQ